MTYRGERSHLSERYAEVMKVLPVWRQDDTTAAAIEIGVLAERERCAKIAEEKYTDPGWHFFLQNAGICIAAAIRATTAKDNSDDL